MELDSFCQRETTPPDASINNVGMESLVSSKLYGLNGTLYGCRETTVGTPCPGPDRVVGIYATSGTCNTACTGYTLTGTGPGKHNFIGFGAETCSNAGMALADAQIRGYEGTIQTTGDTACIVDESSYEMGVYGHLSGQNYFGVSVDHNGVVSTEHNVVFANRAIADSGC